MKIETIALIISIIAVVVAIHAVRTAKKIKAKEQQHNKNLEVEKISLPGFDVKVLNGELTFTPKK
tara:strand:+ start:812 stop:1006 length:195 start_codon:yes stop_codon:yes gene_type:complete